jgi:uncharacterized membrane protein YuzA (DUF378 family)
MKTLNALDWTALVLLIIGGINWGLIGFFGLDLVAAIFGTIAPFIYALVGLAALYVVFLSPLLARKVQFRPHRATQQPI